MSAEWHFNIEIGDTVRVTNLKVNKDGMAFLPAILPRGRRRKQRMLMEARREDAEGIVVAVDLGYSSDKAYVRHSDGGIALYDWTELKIIKLGNVPSRGGIVGKNIRKGQLVWWKCSRGDSVWSCPCIVTRVNEDSFMVLVFDELKRIKISRDSRGAYEMKMCSIKKVCRYFWKKEKSVSLFITKEKIKLDHMRRKHETYIRRAENIMKKFKY